MKQDDFAFFFDDGIAKTAVRKSTIEVITGTPDRNHSCAIATSNEVITFKKLDSETVIHQLFGNVEESAHRIEIGECRNNNSGDNEKFY